MAGLSSIATTAIQAINVANTVMGAVDRYNKNSGKQEYSLQRARMDLENQRNVARADQERQKIALDAKYAEEKRMDALRRAVAKQRARSGAEGTGSFDGSGQAVLLGMVGDSERAQGEREALDNFKLSAIEQNLGNEQRINTLQLAQLEERNKLKQAGAVLDAVGAIL